MRSETEPNLPIEHSRECASTVSALLHGAYAVDATQAPARDGAVRTRRQNTAAPRALSLSVAHGPGAAAPARACGVFYPGTLPRLQRPEAAVRR